jgi:hypothetical protein
MGAIAFLAGGMAWSASEYFIHRFVGHGPKRQMPTTRLGRLSPIGLAYEFNREHLMHHANPSYFAATSKKVMAASIAIPALGAVLSPIMGVRTAASFALGFGTVYASYEVIHRILHTRAPRTRYGRWFRQHHLLHHHKTPRNNHGVTSALWDHVFGTHDPAERVRIPKHVLPKWLVDEGGRIKPEYAGDYEIAGKPQASTMSNVPSIPSEPFTSPGASGMTSESLTKGSIGM